MKSFLVALLLIFSFESFSQFQILFDENFDGSAPYQVTNSLQTNIGATASTSTWDTTSFNSASGPNSYRVQGSFAGNKVLFETGSFSTIGSPYVNLTFDHIAKLYLANQGEVSISTDGGLTFIPIPERHYIGSDVYRSALYVANEYFNAGSYVIPSTGINLWLSSSNLPTNANMWVNEVFDLRGLAYDTIVDIGYTDVRLRFSVDFNFTTPAPALNFYDGWYVDNIIVKGSICDPRPSALNYNIGTNPIHTYKPIGSRPENTSGDYEIRCIVTHPEGINNVNLIWAKNGVIDTLNMNLINITSSVYSGFISTLTLGDTIDWRIEIDASNCSLVTKSPNLGSYQFYIDPIRATKCGFIPLNQNPFVINSFPWTEDFENGLGWTGGASTNSRGTFLTTPIGNWRVNPSTTASNSLTSYAWSIADDRFWTPPSLSGPNINHTPNGTNFLYSVGSRFSPNPGASYSTTNFITPCIELTDSLYYSFDFWYHFYGQDIGDLRIDIDTGETAPSWWQDYFSIVGEKQTQNSSPWEKATFSLALFRGKTIRIRFVSRKFTAGSNAFMALDDFSIQSFTPESIDVQLINFVLPSSNKCTYSSNEIIQFVISNEGIDTLQTIPFAYQLNGGAIVRDTAFNLQVIPGQIFNFQFAQSIDLSAIQTHDLKVWAELMGDTINTNDTLDITYTGQYGLSTFPYQQVFETSSAGVNLNQTGSLNDNRFILNNIDNSSTNGSKWMIYDGKVRKLTNGPLGGEFREGKYLLFTNEGNPATLQNAEYASECIDFNGLSHPQLSFKYHCISPQASLDIKIKEVGATNWLSLAVLGPVQITNEEDYVAYQYDLSAYAGKIVFVSFEATNNLTPNQYIALDDIQIFERQALDFGIVSVVDPSYIELEKNNPFNVTFNYINASPFTATLATVRLRMELKDLCNPTATPITGSSQPLFTTLALGQTGSSNLSMIFTSTIPPGIYEMKAWIKVVGDTNRNNDTLIRKLQVFGTQSIPYLNDFESCSPEFYAKGDIYDWERTTPAKTSLNGAKSGQKCWVTHSDSMSIGSSEYLFTPLLTGFDTAFTTELRFWSNYDFGSGYGTVEYFDQGIWRNLSSNFISSINWNTSFNAQLGEFVLQGTSNGWIYSSISLAQFNGRVGPLRLRFKSVAENGAGWAIDDFEIFVPGQNAIAPLEFNFLNQNPPKVGVNPYKLKVINKGSKVLDEFFVTLNINGSLGVTEHVVLSNPVYHGQSLVKNMITPAQLVVGLNNIEIITSLPNNKVDGFQLDDTLKTKIYVLQSNVSLPYCNDFEQSGAFANYDFLNAREDTNWIHGTFNKPLLGNAYSGVQSWYTSSYLYQPLQNQYLFTPDFLIDKDQCYNLSFWHEFDTEYNLDGGTFEYTIDTGNTWLTLGNFNDTMWYNTPHIQALDAFRPGWSGNSSGWQKAKKTIQFYKAGTVQFRFRFASNSTVHQEGWVIDDFCFELSNDACNFISQGEFAFRENSILVYPNPTADQLFINYSGQNHGKAMVSVLNMLGQNLKSIDVRVTPNENIELDVNELAKGLYSIRIIFENLQSESALFEKL